jgi:hypothetical protein
MQRITTLLMILVLGLIGSACTPRDVPESTSPAESADSAYDVILDPTRTSAPVPEQTLPQNPQDLTFQTPQGRTLQGRYFPAAKDNAPLVILVHWVMSNQDDWQVVAAWLQNRGQSLPRECTNPSGCYWWDPSWFPSMGETSYAVFTFSLTSCETSMGCTGWTGDVWAEDANAAIQYASQLPGVDPTRIVTAGASIGADAAIDSCAWFDLQGGPARCVGAMSFSPGNYLDLAYEDQVTSLEGLSIPAWCLYAEGDSDSNVTCNSASGTNYTTYAYAGSAHGMMLIAPERMPKNSNKTTLELFLAFLNSMVGR